MKSSQFVKKFVLIFLVGVSMLMLTACGDSKYVDALNANLTTVNSAMQPMNQQIDKLNKDNAVLSDKTWQDATSAAVDSLASAGKAFANLPQAPDRLKGVDALVKELAFEINSFGDSYHTMINNQDLKLMDTANSHMDKINGLISKINDAIAAANK